MSLNNRESLFPMNQFSVIRQDGLRVYFYAVQYGPTSHSDCDYVLYTERVRLFSRYDVYAACFDRNSQELKIWPIEDEATWQIIRQNMPVIKNVGLLRPDEPQKAAEGAKGVKPGDIKKFPGAKLVSAPKRRSRCLSAHETEERNRKLFPDNRLFISDDIGNRKGFDVVLTTFMENSGKSFVVYTDGQSAQGIKGLYASSYDITADIPVLSDVENSAEWSCLEQLVSRSVKDFKWKNRD